MQSFLYVIEVTEVVFRAFLEVVSDHPAGHCCDGHPIKVGSPARKGKTFFHLFFKLQAALVIISLLLSLAYSLVINDVIYDARKCRDIFAYSLVINDVIYDAREVNSAKYFLILWL